MISSPMKLIQKNFDGKGYFTFGDGSGDATGHGTSKGIGRAHTSGKTIKYYKRKYEQDRKYQSKIQKALRSVSSRDGQVVQQIPV